VISDTVIHDIIRHVIHEQPLDVMQALSQKNRIPSKMLSQKSWKFINSYKERPVYIPKNRLNGKIPDIDQQQGFLDVVWIFTLSGVEAIIAHEIKTGDIDIISILKKYAGSLYSKNNIVSNKSQYLTVCGGNESHLYVWGWHEKIIEAIPDLKENPFNTLFRKGLVKIVPIEWIFTLINNKILDAGMAIIDNTIRDKVEMVELIPYTHYRKMRPEQEVDWDLTGTILPFSACVY
jgi:hypothetical protein